MLLALILTALFIGLAMWGLLRYAKTYQQAKHDRLMRAGFRLDKDPAHREALQNHWGAIEPTMHSRSHPDYTIWHLDKSDDDGPRPILVVVFDTPVERPLEGWIIPAFAKEDGWAMKLLSGLAHLAGHKHRLPVPSAFDKQWWAWGKGAYWMPVAPPDALWHALQGLSSLSIEFSHGGLKFDVLPDRNTHKTPPAELLTEKSTIATVEAVAESLLSRRL